jgi:hypothetical protein
MVIFFLKRIARKCQEIEGLVWRGDERIKSKDDIFHLKKTRTMKISQSNKSSSQKEAVPMKTEKKL